MAGVRRDRKRVKEAHQIGLRITDDPTERLRRMAEKKLAAPVPIPQTIKPFRSTLEVDVRAIHGAEKLAPRHDDGPPPLVEELVRRMKLRMAGNS